MAPPPKASHVGRIIAIGVSAMLLLVGGIGAAVWALSSGRTTQIGLASCPTCTATPTTSPFDNPTYVPPTTSTTLPPPMATTGNDNTSTVTLANYNAIQSGMTISQVEAILGEPTSNTRQAFGGGTIDDVAQWQNDANNYAFVTINFQNGIVSNTQESGL